ncbi:MAG: single-stranded-DNA-specific exonuclease RecJ [Deltaproteobacteria bacterium]|nr:single-stranded-DNA-specific exonuclease RecJ [Deltaproteobacteria bacterium]
MQKHAQKEWQIPPSTITGETSLFHELGVSPLTGRLLANRGIMNLEEARQFLSPTLSHLPDPVLMKDMDKAVARVLQAIIRKEKITLFGDYDVDGTTAVALLYLFLQRAGAAVDFYIPNRIREGYGIRLEAIKKIYDSGTRLLITLDCGVSNFAEVSWAGEKGLDVIITDHHEVPDRLPPALAVVNPKRTGCPYPFKSLAGVGVAFNLVIALRSALRRQDHWKNGDEPNLKKYLDLVALGTVSDVVPLIGVNRVMAKFGLAELTHSTRPGILALKEVANLTGMPIDTQAVNFRLAPRMNAAGRLEDAQEVVRLLISEDGEEARKIATHLDQLNSLRQRIEEKMLGEARELIATASPEEMKKSIVLASPQWHVGVLGIVASRLSEEYHKPTILIALMDSLGKGSGRSSNAFSLYSGLKACQTWLETFGGHEQAAGILIRRERIADFAQAFDEIVGRKMNAEAMIPKLPIDAMATLDQMDDSFMADLEALSPFGTENPEPILGMENVTVLESRLVGRGHLKLRIQDGRTIREAIGFGLAQWQPMAKGRLHLALSPQIGVFQGRRFLQLRIVDLKPPESPLV